MTQVTSAHLGESLGTDFFSVREQFTDDQWSHFITVRRFGDEEVVPVVGPYWERAEICWPLVKRLPELGIVGEDIKGYGCAGMSPMACGLVTMELHRGDGSLGVFLGVHAGLAMQSIAMCGSEEQKARWLPGLARMDKLGAFALTEPEHGSDSVALETTARLVKGDREAGGGWVLNGRKRWIGLGTVADLIVVWARNTDDGQVNAFVVEKGSPGYQAQVIEGKVSLRSVWQADITLDEVRVPAGNRLQALATRFDATDVLSDALNTQAASRAAKGLDWAGQMRRALEIALSGGHHQEAARAYTNLCGIHADKREFAEAEWYLVAAVAYCEEHDITTYAICLRGEQSALRERTGRWDEAIALSSQILIDTGPSPVNRLCALIRLGAMRARRGEPGAWECLDEAATTADETGEPQHQIPVRLARAEAHWLEGRPDAARLEAELADDACASSDAWSRGAVAAWLRRTGSSRPVRGEVAEPYRLMLDGDPVGAAHVWTHLGCPYEAAMSLADAPGDHALRQALSIVTSLGAQPAAWIIRKRRRAPGARSAVASSPERPLVVSASQTTGVTCRWLP